MRRLKISLRYKKQNQYQSQIFRATQSEWIKNFKYREEIEGYKINQETSEEETNEPEPPPPIPRLDVQKKAKEIDFRELERIGTSVTKRRSISY